MVTNLLEAVGFQATSNQYWGPDVMVGLSSLYFGFPACAFVAVFVELLREHSKQDGSAAVSWPPLELFTYPVLACGFMVVTVTSCLADFVYIRPGHRSWYGKVDIVSATAVFILCNLDFVRRAGLAETFVCFLLAVAAFIYSSASTSLDIWVIRHTIWHAVGGLIGTYVALRQAPHMHVIGPQVHDTLLRCFIVYVSLALPLVLVVAWCAPQAIRQKAWNVGAGYADWQRVHPTVLDPRPKTEDRGVAVIALNLGLLAVCVLVCFLCAEALWNPNEHHQYAA